MVSNVDWKKKRKAWTKKNDRTHHQTKKHDDRAVVTPNTTNPTRLMTNRPDVWPNFPNPHDVRVLLLLNITTKKVVVMMDSYAVVTLRHVQDEHGIGCPVEIDGHDVHHHSTKVPSNPNLTLVRDS